MPDKRRLTQEIQAYHKAYYSNLRGIERLNF